MNSRHLSPPSDVRLFLVLIPLINGVNYYLTYTQIPSGWRLPATFLIDTTQGYAAWWVARSLIRRFDRTWPYERNPIRRISVQLLTTTLAGVGVIAVTTEIINYFATDKPVPRAFYTHHLFIFAIWFMVVNGIYIGLYFYEKYQQARQQHQEAIRLRTDGFTVRSGKQTLQLPFSDILAFYVDGDYTMVSTRSGQTFVADVSLDKLEPTLPAEWFFRANRQWLLHRQSLIGFDRLENGKLRLHLRSDGRLPETVVVSRTKAPLFRQWYGAD